MIYLFVLWGGSSKTLHPSALPTPGLQWPLVVKLFNAAVTILRYVYQWYIIKTTFVYSCTARNCIFTVCGLLNTTPQSSYSSELFLDHSVQCFLSRAGGRPGVSEAPHMAGERADTGSGLHKVCKPRGPPTAPLLEQSCEGPWTPLNRWYQRHVETAPASQGIRFVEKTTSRYCRQTLLKFSTVKCYWLVERRSWGTQTSTEVKFKRIFFFF